MEQGNQRNGRSARNRALKRMLLGGSCALLMSGTASAAVISNAMLVDFTGGSISFGYNGTSDFTFSDVSGGFFFNPNSVGVSTLNGAAVTALGEPFYSQLTPTIYSDPRYGGPTSEFGPTTFQPFVSFPTTTAIPSSLSTFIIGLRDVAADGVHYGYGEFAGTQLISYGFETTAGKSIVSPVPLPASAPMFGAALLGLAGLGYAAKRRREAAAA